MSAELQPLLDRIQKEAVEKAEQQAGEILRAAREKAQALVKEAEAEAGRRLEKADKDAQAFTERSNRTLEQTARDVLITVGKGVDTILADLVREEVNQALKPDVVQQMLVAMADRYAQAAGDGASMDVLVNPEHKDALIAFFREKYRGRLAGGVQVRGDRDVFRGFQVSFRGGKVYHDFTGEAIAAALTGFLRPQLADVVQRAAGKAPARS